MIVDVYAMKKGWMIKMPTTLGFIKGLMEHGEREFTKGDSKLELKESGTDGIKVGIKKNGQKYSVRDDRRRFFFPDEWYNFMNGLDTHKQTITAYMLIHTGARISEAKGVCVKDIDFERRTMTLRKTKTKAAKGETKGKPRTIKISTYFRDNLRTFCVGKNPDDEIGMLSIQQTFHMVKDYCKKSGIKDWKNFSAHNFRKTHGNYLKALGMDGMEICQRLGHDMNTFLSSYGSPDIFSKEDKEKIKQIIGDVV